MRDRHLQIIAERGRMTWQKAAGYNWRAMVEADISRFNYGHALTTAEEAKSRLPSKR
jgi:hypothetical protein